MQDLETVFPLKPLCFSSGAPKDSSGQQVGPGRLDQLVASGFRT